MPYDRFMIAPLSSGLQTDVKPWQILDDSFARLNNAYNFRGRIRKRFGARLMNSIVTPSQAQLYSRLRINLGNTTNSGFSGTVPGIQFNVGQLFSVGTQIFTVYQAGTPAAMLFTSPGVSLGNTDGSGNASGIVFGANGIIGQYFTIGGQTFTVTASSGPLTPSGIGTGTGTFDTSTGAYTFTGADALSQITFYATVTATYNTTTGAVAISNAEVSVDMAVYWYPALPVTGLANFQQVSTVLYEPTFAFDTQFSYYYSSATGGWEILGPVPAQSGSALWTGTSSQLFWSTTWAGATPQPASTYLFVTNFNAPDGIKYFNTGATPPSTNTWKTLNPVVSLGPVQLQGTPTDGSGNAAAAIGSAGNIGDVFIIGASIYVVTVANGALFTALGSGTGTFDITTPGNYTFTGAPINTVIQYFPVGATLTTALILVVFKNRLLALNTIETTSGTPINYPNRVRWASFGDPTNPIAWNSFIPGQGNALDAATLEDIVSCEFIKDRLIVFFESSTWELAYTGNQAQPFTWQKINTELGTESPFSVVPFDKVALAIGNTGIHACNGANVERVDNDIPYSVWSISAGVSSVARVYGIRDYYAEQVYWTFPNPDANQYSTTYPNKILVYNYLTQSWALNDDSITVFGYYYLEAQSSITWSSQDVTWDNNLITWDGGTGQPLNQNILAGNQEGFVFIVDTDQTSNAPALQVTNVYLSGVTSGNVTFTVVDHNLNINDYIYVEWLNGLVGPFVAQYQVISISNSYTFTVVAPDIWGVLIDKQKYTGGATITRISQIDILTKQFNFYIDNDRNIAVQYINFLVDRTASGAITIDFLPSTSPFGSLQGAITSNALTGTSVLETFPYDASLYPQEQYQDRLWHPVYILAEGNAVQLRIYLSPAQLTDFGAWTSDFQMHAMTFYVTRSESRAQ